MPSYVRKRTVYFPKPVTDEQRINVAKLRELNLAFGTAGIGGRRLDYKMGVVNVMVEGE
jgi:hypothetical protein